MHIYLIDTHGPICRSLFDPFSNEHQSNCKSPSLASVMRMNKPHHGTVKNPTTALYVRMELLIKIPSYFGRMGMMILSKCAGIIIDCVGLSDSRSAVTVQSDWCVVLSHTQAFIAKVRMQTRLSTLCCRRRCRVGRQLGCRRPSCCMQRPMKVKSTIATHANRHKTHHTNARTPIQCSCTYISLGRVPL